MSKKFLREGFTTGSCATAASMAALLHAAGAHTNFVLTPMPPFTKGLNGEMIAADWRILPVAAAGCGAAPEALASGEGTPLAHASIIKNGGDDPDATHGALINASLFADIKNDGGECPRICGGPGIGMVTKSGLAARKGDWAINPVPRKQIRHGFAAALNWLPSPLRATLPRSFQLVLTVPNGEQIAKKTMNAKLGIIGGISILGTHGISRPYSNDAWRASIALEMALIPDKDIVCLCTGRRSEKLLRDLYPWLPEANFIQVADMAAYALRRAAGFKEIVWGCFFGKLIKLAQGLENTHAHQGELDLEIVAALCAQGQTRREIKKCTTAMAALEILKKHDFAAIEAVLLLARDNMRMLCGKSPRIYLFDSDGAVVAPI